jgi:hypothetical protein
VPAMPPGGGDGLLIEKGLQCNNGYPFLGQCSRDTDIRNMDKRLAAAR